MKDDLTIMLRNGWDFQEAYYRCITPIKCKNSNCAKILFIAAMSNISLSCEIYLKLLYYIENGKKIRGHDLYKLFNLLSVKTKNCIIKIMKLQYKEEDFYAKLNYYKDTFNKWRYYNEWASEIYSLNYKFLEKFSQSLFVLCKSKI